MAHPEVREGLGGPPGVPEDSPRGPGEVRCPTRRFGRGRETLPVGWDVSGGPPRSPGEVRRSMRRVGRGQEVHPDVRKGLVGPIERQEGVGWLTRWAEWCWEVLPEGREGLGVPCGGTEDPPGGPGGVGRPTRSSCGGREAHPEFRTNREAYTVGQERMEGSPGGP